MFSRLDVERGTAEGGKREEEEEGKEKEEEEVSVGHSAVGQESR